MGWVIFALYMAIAAAVAYGVMVVIHNIRKHDSKFLITGCCYSEDCQYRVAILLGIFWPLAAPIGFAILLAYEKTVKNEEKP